MLGFRSHSQDVRGSIRVIYKRTLMLGKSSNSQSLITTAAGDASLSLGEWNWHVAICSLLNLQQEQLEQVMRDSLYILRLSQSYLSLCSLPEAGDAQKLAINNISAEMLFMTSFWASPHRPTCIHCLPQNTTLYS